MLQQRWNTQQRSTGLMKADAVAAVLLGNHQVIKNAYMMPCMRSCGVCLAVGLTLQLRAAFGDCKCFILGSSGPTLLLLCRLSP